MEKLKFYKATGPGGLAYHDNSTQYVVGKTLTIEDPSPASAGACGRGLHVVRELAHLREYVENLTEAEFYEVAVDPSAVIAADQTKTRVSSLRVVRRVDERHFGIRRGRLCDLIRYGYGHGYGYGYGDGYGYGHGSGDGYGSGDGSGSGSGDGSGYGHGSGDGYGSGDGSGSGSGDGYGEEGA